MKLSRRSLIPTALVGAFALCGIMWCLYLVFNPDDINHLVLIRDVPGEHAAPFAAELNGEVQWTQKLEFHGGHGTHAPPAAVAVADIHRAWFSGELSINDSGGATLAQVDLSPPGRYCGTLVVRLTQSGKTLAAWNRLPGKGSIKGEEMTSQ